MKPYIGIVHRDGDTAYGIAFPDAPGCFSAADHLDDLFDMAEEALELWCEAMTRQGFALTRPRDLSALRDDPTWAESFADAVLLIAVPPPDLARRDAA